MRRNKCEECNGLIKEKEVDYFLLGQNLGKYKAEVCTKCGEQVFGEEVVEKVQKKAKELGLWNLHAKVKVNQVGNSIAVTITKPISEFLNLKKGKDVDIYPENKKRLIIEIPY